MKEKKNGKQEEFLSFFFYFLTELGDKERDGKWRNKETLHRLLYKSRKYDIYLCDLVILSYLIIK